MMPFKDDYLTETFLQAQEACARDGARLWEPRNVDGFISLKRFYNGQSTQTNFPNGYSGQVALAIGMKMNESKAYYPDGTRVPSQILDLIVSWETGHPKSGELCVYFVNEKMQSLPCIGPSKSGLIKTSHLLCQVDHFVDL